MKLFPEEFDQALAVKDQGHVVKGWAVVNVDNLVYNNNIRSMRLCYHQMAVPVPSISYCGLNHHNVFYQIQNALAFNQDTCYHLALCLQLLPFHMLTPMKTV